MGRLPFQGNASTLIPRAPTRFHEEGSGAFFLARLLKQASYIGCSEKIKINHIVFFSDRGPKACPPEKTLDNRITVKLLFVVAVIAPSWVLLEHYLVTENRTMCRGGKGGKAGQFQQVDDKMKKYEEIKNVCLQCLATPSIAKSSSRALRTRPVCLR